MGFLDHSTNNIIVDAVLTDLGREILSKATSTENFIFSYAFADDEVDYTVIKKYGPVVGKEKIEKNTPVFEASTNSHLGVKYFLQTSENPLVTQPTLSLSLNGVNALTGSVATTTLTMTVSDEDKQLEMVSFTIQYDWRFLSPTGAYQPRKVQNSTTLAQITIESPSREQTSVVFTKGTKGKKLLENASQTQKTLSILVTGNKVSPKSIPITVSY